MSAPKRGCTQCRTRARGASAAPPPRAARRGLPRTRGSAGTGSSTFAYGCMLLDSSTGSVAAPFSSAAHSSGSAANAAHRVAATTGLNATRYASAAGGEARSAGIARAAATRVQTISASSRAPAASAPGFPGLPRARRDVQRAHPQSAWVVGVAEPCATWAPVASSSCMRVLAQLCAVAIAHKPSPILFTSAREQHALANRSLVPPPPATAVTGRASP